MTSREQPARTLGTLGAVGIGVGSMLGAGVFSVWGPAAQSAGGWLLAAVALAACVAAVNAYTTARLAARHPVAGGSYTYGSRELRGPWGFVAGIGFVVGKTASVAAMALTVGAYAAPGHERAAATLAIAAAWALNARGVTRTALAATVVAALVIVGLAAVVVASLTQPAHASHAAHVGPVGVRDVAQAAALVFFAFAGYARLATLGEEVREPTRTIPRAIAIAVAAVVAVYAAIALALLRRPGDGALAGASRPLALAAPDAAAWRVGLGALAAVAAMGAMIALLAGLGRTAMAMAREGDLPRVLARTNARSVPSLTEALVGAVAVALAWAVDLRLALAVSSVAVLAYYAVAHAAAIAARRRDASLRVPLAASAAGLALCVALAASLDPTAVALAAGSAALAVALRAALRAEWRGSAPR